MKHKYPKIQHGPFKGRYEAPQGQLIATFEQAHEACCLQAELDELRPMYSLLMVETRLNPCDSCPVWDSNGPECECFQLYHTDWQHRQRKQCQELVEATTPNNAVSPSLVGLNMKQIAAKLGVSLNKTRQMKREGLFN